WPTPSELVNTGCQNVISQGNKKLQNRKEKEENVEKRSNNESKENRETASDGPGGSVCEDEAQLWALLHLDDVGPDSQETPGSQSSSRCQPEANKPAHNNRRNDTRNREKRDDQDEVSSVRSEGGNIQGSLRGRGRGRGNPQLNFDYSYGRQVCPVEEALCKEYIKHQIEYYSNTENLEWDFFLQRKMDEQGFLPISLIAGFHRAQALTTNLNLILAALKDSAEVEIMDEKMRKKIEPEKWPIPGPPPRNVPQTDFCQLNDCPEFVPGQAFYSHTESAPNSPRIGSPLSPKKNSETSNLQVMSRGLSTSLPDLDLEPWIELKKRHHLAPVKLKESVPVPKINCSSEEPEQEELDFLFDEEMEQIEGQKNIFTDWSDNDSNYEIDDQDLNKIFLLLPRLEKHPGGDRTVINDGLYYYEQDLWMKEDENKHTAIKVLVFG
uniref:HTH La-type RNA-binding domain-containing protein n=1 Tax=Microcebus murinus TaxID=30608 RepID=A0A8C5VWL6_MICMU